MSSLANHRIVLTGGAGFLGSYVVENLVSARGVDRSQIVVPRSATTDLRDPAAVAGLFQAGDVVLHLAAVTGGISFSRAFPASQYCDSTLIDVNVIRAAAAAKVARVVALGNLFAYAGDAPIPLDERDLFNGLPTDSHRGVGWFKRNLAVMADLVRREFGLPMSVVYSANAYGPRDSTDRQHAHVIPATIMKCLFDKELIVWGDGTPTRDFLYAADIAEAIALTAERVDVPAYLNIGSGREVTIRELVTTIATATGFSGKLEFDASKAGGDARRCTSTGLASTAISFAARTPFATGIQATVDWYRQAAAQGLISS